MSSLLSLCVGFLLFVVFVSSETLMWYDEFDTFNLNVWKHEITAGGGGNWEFEYYYNNRSNSFVKDGVLHIRPTLTADRLGEQNLRTGGAIDLWGTTPADLCTGNAYYGCHRDAGGGGNILNPIQSARVRTAETFSFQYGRLEIRAKLPKGDWLWPALWLLPRLNAYGNWPASGEIDIVESRGNAPSYPGGVNAYSSTLHWGPFYPLDPWSKTHETYQLPSGDFSQDFHVFGLVWNDNQIYTYVDSPKQVVLNVTFDIPLWTLGGWDKSQFDNPWVSGGTNAPFDQEFYIVFDLAVGGTGGYFPDGVGGKPWSDTDPNAVNAFYNAKDSWYPTWTQDMQIDYIRLYQ